MKKRLILNILAAVLLVAALAPAALALEDVNIASGTCGEGITWSLDGYTLTVTGSGEMEDGAPWADHKDHIEHLVLTGGITKVGKEAFYKYDRLETVDFGDSLVEIGDKAFYGCEDIDYIHLPDTFRKFGAQSFRACESLKFVYCDGPMPRFSDSCLTTGNYISVFYPTNNPWPWEYTSQLVQNFGGRLGIMMGNFDESAVMESLTAYEPTEETEAEEEETEPETTAETEAATEAPTEAATEPAVAALVTEPVTEATETPTVPATEPETVPTETTIPETTEETTVAATEEVVETTELELFTEPTEEEEPVKKLKSNSWIGLVMIGGVLTFLISGAMIFRSVSKRGGRYR